jgi:hypothetical protein
MQLLAFWLISKSVSRRAEQLLSGGVDTSGRGEEVRERIMDGEYGANILYTCM